MLLPRGLMLLPRLCRSLPRASARAPMMTGARAAPRLGWRAPPPLPHAWPPRVRTCVSSSASSSSEAGSAVALARGKLTPAREALFRPIFDEMARGQLISTADLRDGIERAVPGCSVTDEEVARMMRIADVDGSGRVDFDEFIFLFEDIEDDSIGLTSLAQYWLGYSDQTRNPELVFNAVWKALAARLGGAEHVRLPSEMMFLGGAPGAGKGTMTPYIQASRGMTGEAIVISSLLNSPAAKKIIDEGGLVGDMEVFTMLLEKLIEPDQRHGALVDGFPRTVEQVHLLQLLHSKMKEASRTYDHTELAEHFPRPRVRMCILYVDEHLSIERQLNRGRQAIEHNRRVQETGEGATVEVRETDLSVKAAKHRYRLFVEGTMRANEALKQSFPFNIINASGSVDEVRHVVMQELSYQSSLELQEDTYAAIKHIPTAAEVTTRARQNLVARLDYYQNEHEPTFAAVIAMIEGDFLPVIRRHALVGQARVSSLDSEVLSSPLALDMVVDLMYDRGFNVCAEARDAP